MCCDYFDSLMTVSITSQQIQKHHGLVDTGSLVTRGTTFVSEGRTINLHCSGAERTMFSHRTRHMCYTPTVHSVPFTINFVSPLHIISRTSTQFITDVRCSDNSAEVFFGYNKLCATENCYAKKTKKKKYLLLSFFFSCHYFINTYIHTLNTVFVS